MGTEKMKLVCDKTVGGVTAVRLITTASGNQGSYVDILAGQGMPFWLWPSVAVPAGQKLIACDYTDAPISSTASTAAQRALDNNAMISGITLGPTDLNSNGDPILTFGPI